MEYINSLKQIKSNIKPYQNWEKEQEDRDCQRKELAKKYKSSPEELQKASQYGRTLVDSINIMDKYATDKSQDVEMASKTLMATIMECLFPLSMGLYMVGKNFPAIKKLLNKLPKEDWVNQTLFFASGMILPFVASPFLYAKAAVYEKEAARTARFEAREQKLKDSRNFVVYDNDQIAQAKEIAKTLPEVNEKKKSSANPIKAVSEAFSSVKSVVKDHKEYLAWKDNYIKDEANKKERLEKLNYTPDEMKNAESDQQNLLRTVRKIEINSQVYQSNVKLGLDMLLASGPILGTVALGVTSGIEKILEKCKVLPKNSKTGTIAKGIAGIFPLILTFGAAIYTPGVEKKAALVGRYKAKKELMENPDNFVEYTKEQYDSVKDIKAPEKQKQSFFKKFKTDISFLFQYKKDAKEYKTYQKGAYKEELKLEEALKKVNITDAQAQASKSLQKNAFKTFEKVDEMSQRYSADVEAATDTVKTAVNDGSNILAQGLSGYFMYKSLASKNPNNFIKSFYSMLAPLVLILPIDIKGMQLQKQACKIGIMNANKDLSDPREFINKQQ
jgi:hypothetical protein